MRTEIRICGFGGQGVILAGIILGKSACLFDGKEAVQLYVGANDSIVTRPLKELRAFDKKMIKKGETVTYEFELGYRDFAYYNTLYPA